MHCRISCETVSNLRPCSQTGGGCWRLEIWHVVGTVTDVYLRHLVIASKLLFSGVFV